MDDPRCWLFEQVMRDPENARAHAIATVPSLAARLRSPSLVLVPDPRRDRRRSSRIGLALFAGTAADGPFLLALGLQGRGATRSMVEDEIAALVAAVVADDESTLPLPDEVYAVVVRAGSDVSPR